RGIIDRAAARPEAGAAHLVGIGFGGDFIRQVGHAAGMTRRAPAGKARHREIETAPEEMYRARLAEEGGAELLEDPVDVEKNLQKASHRVRVIRGVLVVLREADRLRQFIGHLVDCDVNAELRELGYDRRIEARDRVAGERKLPPGAVAGGTPQ